MDVTFLGTSSGGGPTEARNCSSLVLSLLGDGSLWMVDCAEGTNRQFKFQPKGQPYVKPTKVTNLFITHMHADHVMGLVPFLRNVLFPPPAGSPPPLERTPPRIQIYGPAGLRTFIRQNLKMTLTFTRYTYTVHELLTANDKPTPCDLPHNPHHPQSGLDVAHQNILHACEVPGRDIRADDKGLWTDVLSAPGILGNIVVTAGPIHHRDPCIGYIFTESEQPNRRLVILGDTYDPSPIIPLCVDPPPSLLVHEATDAHIPPHSDPFGNLSKRTKAEVRAVALARGHSVPEMAGEFAKKIHAQRLVLNHVGARFPFPRRPRDGAHMIVREIEQQATRAWGSGNHAVLAHDFLRVTIPAPAPLLPDQHLTVPSVSQYSVEREGTSGDSSRTAHVDEKSFQVHHANPAEGFLYVDNKYGDKPKKRRR
ncbi:beta-lactamase-like protein [Cyathus striatus]|nr:beta-lactamase-like protein [Cyathus striatus]